MINRFYVVFQGHSLVGNALFLDHDTLLSETLINIGRVKELICWRYPKSLLYAE